MAREFSFDTFPYETFHYSILSNSNNLTLNKTDIDCNKESFNSIKISLITDVVDDAVYSIYYESEHCQLICSLYGPLPILKNSILPDKTLTNNSNIFYNIRYAPYCYKREWLNHKNSQTDIILSRQLANTIDSTILYDETNSVKWDVQIKVLSHDAENINFFDGSLLGFGMSILSPSINCTSILLTLAGIPLKGIISSANVLCIEHTKDSNLDLEIFYNPSGNIIKSFMSQKYCTNSKSSISKITFGHAAFINFGSLDDRIVSSFTLIGKSDYKLIMKYLLSISWKIFIWQKQFIEDSLIKNNLNTDQWL